MRHVIFGFAVTIGLTMTANGFAGAADFKSTVLKDGRVVVSVTGEISLGDTDSLKAAIKSANDAGKLVTSIRLSSDGGNLLEGVRLADAVKFAKMATNVGKDATCASACFLVFAAGETKFANYGARIGVHGASDKGVETVQSGAATVSMARVAKDLGVPPSIIGRMVVTPPNEMVWLSPADLRTMGTTMVGKPAQTTQSLNAPEPQSLGEPTQLSPQVKATRSPPTWNELVDKAMNLSANQNNGKADLARFCQPSNKTCAIAVTFKNAQGKASFLKIVQNIDGKTIRREICELNEFNDVRSCVDWDKGTIRRDMKNVKGDWEEVD